MSVEVIQGDCLEVLRRLAAERGEFVQCCVTSPPYWGLRKYAGEQEVTWLDGTRHPLGLEPTPELYVAHIVEVFRAVRDVLRPDGCAFVNLGDCYAHTGACGGGSPVGWVEPHAPTRHRGDDAWAQTQTKGTMGFGAKPKDLLGMPWRVAFALQADGWWLRSAIVWAKGLSFCDEYAGSVMPESCRDRPTSAYEMVFLLSKSATYHYDWFAARESYVDNRLGCPGSPSPKSGRIPGQAAHTMASQTWAGNRGGRNWRNVWAISPTPFAAAHFATFSPTLVEKCIIAGTSPKACATCGAPWERVVDVSGGVQGSWHDHTADDTEGQRAQFSGGLGGEAARTGYKREETGWAPTCSCKPDDSGRCVVLDPFLGSGTTLLVAKRLGRDGIGIEISSEYCQMARDRCAPAVTAPLFQ